MPRRPVGERVDGRHRPLERGLDRAPDTRLDSRRHPLADVVLPVAGVGGLGGLDRRVGRRGAVDLELEHALGLVDVLQAPLPEREDRDALRQRGAGERPRRLGEQHMAAAPGRAEPGGAYDVEAEVALAAESGLAGVQAHPDADVDAVGPVVCGVRALRLDGRGDRVAGAWKREEEGIALRVDLDAAVLREVLAHQPPVVGDDTVVAVPECLSSAVEPSMSLKTNVTVPLGKRRHHRVCGRVAARGVNRLADETSPYLLQHADNPVDWYPWGDEAFARARDEDRPILLSVGYSACHWCHVMAHESFEDAAIAAVMNERFVNIKVDREERPDVDARLHAGGGGDDRAAAAGR